MRRLTMVGANAVTVINNMRNDPSGITAAVVGIAIIAAVVIVVTLELWSRWKDRRRKK